MPATPTFCPKCQVDLSAPCRCEPITLPEGPPPLPAPGGFRSAPPLDTLKVSRPQVHPGCRDCAVVLTTAFDQQLGLCATCRFKLPGRAGWQAGAGRGTP